MIIDYRNNEIRLFFPFNQKIIDLIKELDNRRWKKEIKAWVVGLSDLDELTKKLSEENIDFKFSDRFNLFFNQKEEKENFGLKFPLYGYQKTGANKLINNPVFGLYDDCGLGKTIMCISAINHFYSKTLKSDFRVLVICPSSLKKQWEEEINKFSTLKCNIIQGTKKKRAMLWCKKVTINIINYELIRFDDQPFEKDWDIIILDEASRAKNSRAKTTKKLKMLKGARKWILTGTPVENSVQDLYSIFQFLDPNFFGNYINFRNNFLITQTNMFGGRMVTQVVGAKNINKLKEKIKPFYIRRTKEEVLSELPDLIEENIWVDLSKEEKKYYKMIAESIKIKKDKIPDEKNAGELQLLRVVCNGTTSLKLSNTKEEYIQNEQPFMVEKSSKNSECIKLIKSIDEKEKIVVFCDFTTALIDLKFKLEKEKIEYCELNGSVKDRDGQLSLFKTDPKKRVFLIQMKTGGYGLNLQEASTVIFLNNPWNPAVKHQAISRCHRNGQKNSVLVYTFVANDTIDERVMSVLSDKKKLSERVILQDINKYI